MVEVKVNRKAIWFTIMILFGLLNLLKESSLLNSFLDEIDQQIEQTMSTHSNRDTPKIAIIASHIPSEQSNDSSRIKLLDHVLNKACYSYLWGYDFIFNMTPGFEEKVYKDAPWLKFGTWHRVPHIKSKINDYDWILYADTDYVFNDMSRPLDSFLKEFKLYGKDPSVFVPRDMPGTYYTFSAFAVMVKNSPFGRKVVDNWLKFGKGLCPNGNIPRNYDRNGKFKYDWLQSDQPGLWWSFVKTHQQFFNPKEANKTHCNNSTGYVNTKGKAFGPEMNEYFRSLPVDKKLRVGMMGHELEEMLDTQPIIWSNSPQITDAEPLNGLGFQWTYGAGQNDTRYKHAFAIHKKHTMPENFHREVELCKTKHGCYANYTEDGELQIGCNGVSYPVPKKV